MLDIKFLRQQPDQVKTALKNRQKDTALVDKTLKTDQKIRELLGQIEKLQADQNQLSRGIKDKPTDDQINTGSQLKKN